MEIGYERNLDYCKMSNAGEKKIWYKQWNNRYIRAQEGLVLQGIIMVFWCGYCDLVYWATLTLSRVVKRYQLRHQAATEKPILPDKTEKKK